MSKPSQVVVDALDAQGPTDEDAQEEAQPAPPHINAGHSVLVQGPSGSGKSSLLRSALEHYGAGVALLAPGDDELESYRGLQGVEGYYIECFEDTGFFPSAEAWIATGHKTLVTRLSQLFRVNQQALQETGALKYPVVCVDTWSGVDQLAVDFAQSKARLDYMPKALSPEGALVYGTIKTAHREVWRGCRANRALGAHILVACHVIEREAELAVAEATTAPIQMPAITGSFRDLFYAGFNLTLHAGADTDPASPRHYVQLQSDPSRLIKQRYRKELTAEKKIDNDWKVLLPLLDVAREGGDDV